MSFIQLTTFVAAPIERVFDLSRSIDLHKSSMQSYTEKPIAGKLHGLMEQNDTVTWQARHLFKQRTLQVRISAMQRPYSFIDEQVKGDFVSMKHEHYFKPIENGTIMIDQFYFEPPFGFIGKVVNQFYLINYMKKLLEQRNKFIKQVAESSQWKTYLS